MTAELKTNKLSVYLIKDGIEDIADIFDDLSSIKNISIDDNATLYYSNSRPKPPSWLYDFFGRDIADSLDSDLYTAYVSAVLIVNVKIKTAQYRKFAVAFGLGGWQLLKPGCYEERFGLMTTLNLIKADSIRSIDKSSVGLFPKQAREQVIVASEAADFGIDIEQDLVRAVTGKCLNQDHGSTITGKDSLHVSAKVNIFNLNDKLRDYFIASKLNVYKDNFDWIDQVAEVKDPVKISSLNDILISKLNSEERGAVWLAVPEIIDWSDVKGFSFIGDMNYFDDDLGLDNLLNSLDSRGKEVNLDILKKQKIVALNESNNQEFKRWAAWSCIYAEVKDEHGGIYILNNSKWYCVETDFAKLINQEYLSIVEEEEILPPFAIEDSSENSYNERVARINGLTLMDAKNIPYGGGHSKIEFCDLFDYNNSRLYHVKNYGGSSTLSHLFNQGLVSAQLMLSDENFRKSVNNILPTSEQFSPVEQKPDARKYEVIFSVISESSNKLNIPFFSKVALKNVKRSLELYGIGKVRLIKIQKSKG